MKFIVGGINVCSIEVEYLILGLEGILVGKMKWDYIMEGFESYIKEFVIYFWIVVFKCEFL